MKRSALNIAWVIKWKNARDGRDKEIAPIITPSCLSVDRAIIFFISHSNIAAEPAINIVEVATINKIILKWGISVSDG